MAPPKRDEALMTLARYFFSADLMCRHAVEHMKSKAARLSAEGPEKHDSVWHTDKTRSYIELWLAALYVVCEGYKKLNCNDALVDKFLADKALVKKLELFRHGVFHYIPKWWAKTNTRLIDEKPDHHNTALAWAINLHSALYIFLRPQYERIVKESER